MLVRYRESSLKIRTHTPILVSKSYIGFAGMQTILPEMCPVVHPVLDFLPAISLLALPIIMIPVKIRRETTPQHSGCVSGPF